MLEDKFETYNPALLAFVIDVSWPNILHVKKQIIESIRQMESDERAYTYHPNDLEIPRWPGQAVGAVANFHRPLDFNIAVGLKQIIFLFSQEDKDFEKKVFVITDSCNSELKHRLNRSLAWNVKEDCGCNFYFLVLKECKFLEEVCEDEIDRHYIFVPSVDDLYDAITSLYKREEIPFFVKNYQRLDVQNLKKNYLKQRECDA